MLSFSHFLLFQRAGHRGKAFIITLSRNDWRPAVLLRLVWNFLTRPQERGNALFNDLVHFFAVKEFHSKEQEQDELRYSSSTTSSKDSQSEYHWHICMAFSTTKTIYTGATTDPVTINHHLRLNGMSVHVQPMESCASNIANTALYFMKQLDFIGCALEKTWEQFVDRCREMSPQGLSWIGCWQELWHSHIVGPGRITRTRPKPMPQSQRQVQAERRVRDFIDDGTTGASDEQPPAAKEPKFNVKGKHLVEFGEMLIAYNLNFAALMNHLKETNIVRSYDLAPLQREVTFHAATMMKEKIMTQPDRVFYARYPIGNGVLAHGTVELHTMPTLRNNKKNHLWIWGPANMGKSSFVKDFVYRNQIPYVQVPVGTNKLPDETPSSRLIWVDDLGLQCNANKSDWVSYSILEGWTNGVGTFSVFKQGLSIPPGIVITTSNHPPLDMEDGVPPVYGELGEVKKAAFNARFTVIKLTVNIMEWLEHHRIEDMSDSISSQDATEALSAMAVSEDETEEETEDSSDEGVTINPNLDFDTWEKENDGSEFLDL